MASQTPILYMDYFVCSAMQNDILSYSRWIEERLFACISSWDDEEGKAIQGFEKMGCHTFDPERDNADYFYESGHEWVISQCLQIAEVNGYMAGVAIVGLYHLWEKQVVLYLKKELLHDWVIEDRKLPQKWSQIVEVFKAYSTNFEDLPFYSDLNELRLVANTVKHGHGVSYKELAETRADILIPCRDSDDAPVIGGEHALLRAEIYPQKKHFTKYKEAALAFWSFDYWRNKGERLPFIGLDK